MGLLEGKNALIFGLANDRSIAWGITQAFKGQGANLGISYAGEALEKRVRKLAEEVNCDFVEACDVSKDEDIRRVADRAAQRGLATSTSWCIRSATPIARS
jgi:enoyl-[acyl-carrier protein] reductase I